MQKRQVSFLLGVALIVFVVFLVLVAVAAFLLMRHRIPVVGGGTVALVRVEGVIDDTTAAIRQLRKYAEAGGVRALVLRVNSPGGTVGGSQELYSAIRRVREESGKPVVVSMGNVAASGGYYIAAAADEIVANPGTLTGSIGVIFSAYNVSEAAEKIGVRVTTIKSGKFKDTGSMFREMSPEEKQLLQGTIDDTYDQFLDAIIDCRQVHLSRALLKKEGHDSPSTAALETENPRSTQTVVTAVAPTGSTTTAGPEDGGLTTDPTQLALDVSDLVSTPSAAGGARPDPRKIERDAVKTYLKQFADGRILTGRQAMEIGLVDRLGTLRDAVDRAARLGGIRGKPNIIQETRKPTLWDVLEGRANVLSKLTSRPTVSLEYRLSFE